jgi:inorganic pyrophosphatase
MANIKVKPSKFMLNLQHVLEPFANDEKTIVNGLVEINAGSVNKYEYITETGHLKLDRVNYSTLTYPTAYGLIPRTWDQDGDMLDFIIANVTEPLVPGSLAELKVIGIMKFEDGGERDDKVITVLADDKRVSHINSYKDLGEQWEKVTAYYFEHYKDLKKPGTCKVIGFFDTAEAVKIIDECIERYNKEYAPKLCNCEHCEDCQKDGECCGECSC